jgi:hypothetical protein
LLRLSTIHFLQENTKSPAETSLIDHHHRENGWEEKSDEHAKSIKERLE